MNRRSLPTRSPGPLPCGARLLWLATLGIQLAGLFLEAALTAQSRPAESPASTPAALSERAAWTSSRLIGSPDPPAPYQAERVFPKLKFQSPVDMCAAPGLDRLFVAEQAGQIYSFKPAPLVARPDLFFSLSQHVTGLNALYGMAFHPGYATNHYLYLCYVLRDGLPEGSRVSRFTVSQTDPPTVDPASEKIVITWLSGGHNGGCLKFGRDGYLYISTGDAANPSPPDPLQTGQDISDLLSSVLRIDVDHEQGGAAYRVPPDNPFVHQANARPEVWAYGLRNPWRMSFDRATGDLWVGDVGWELWEMIYRVEPGGNYGWSIVEGPQSIHPDGKRGPTPIQLPVKAHPHSEAASITGGYVYRGRKLPRLTGAYIYGDWVTGKIWALRTDHGKLTSLEELVDTPLQIVCFGEDNQAELWVVDYGGGIYQLAPNRASFDPLAFPRRLSQTGLFASTRDHSLAKGVHSFEINAEMWADGAVAERFIALPNRSFIQTGASNVWVFQSKNEWRYPTNAVLGKTLSIEVEKGNPKSRRRLETQVLHFDGLDWHAYTYRWNDEQSDATLIGAGGDDFSVDIKDPSAPGGRRSQSWRLHSRAECLRCHNPWVNVALAFTAPQLNRAINPSSRSASGRPEPDRSPVRALNPPNQLRAFSQLGFFDPPLHQRSAPPLTNPYETSAPMQERARTWLHLNCSHCHREGAGGSVASHFEYELANDQMKVLGQAPSQGTLGLSDAHVITPGQPGRSVLLYRVSTTGQGRMPLIGSRVPDTRAVLLLTEWIQQLGQSSSAETPPNAAVRDALHRLHSTEASAAQVEAAIDILLSSPSGALTLFTAILRDPVVQARLPAILPKSSASLLFQVRDLFECFLPDELRVKKLGPNIKPEDILSLKGDAGRGRELLRRGGLQCSQCHRVQGEGRDFGPDLSQIGRKYSRERILEQILYPSKSIDPAYLTYQVETKQEASYSGFLLKRTSEEILLKDATLAEVRIPTGQIKSLEAQQLSAMPEGLLQALSAQDAADLLEYLSSLK
jgi:putative heme-binding domain-containing protein